MKPVTGNTAQTYERLVTLDEARERKGERYAGKIVMINFSGTERKRGKRQKKRENVKGNKRKRESLFC